MVGLIMRKRKYDHITSTLRDDLHWLPIRQRIMYKLSTIVYKCIHGAAPSYLTNSCAPVATNTSRRYLRSATHGDLLVPRTRTVTYGPQSFAVSGPTVWNTLPSTLRVSTMTLGQFQSGVKRDGQKKKISKANERKRKVKRGNDEDCLLYTSPSPRDRQKSRMPSSA